MYSLSAPMAAHGKPAPLEISNTAFPAELDLLLRVARDAISGDVRPAQPDPGIRWEELLRIAELHGLEAFLAQALGGGADFSVPADFRKVLAGNVAEIAARNMALGRETILVSREMRKRGIDHLVYKGPLLAQTLYGTLATRPSRDIDLIVRQEQADAAFDLLTSIGYSDKDQMDLRQRKAAIRFGSEQCFAQSGIEVDLHWQIAPRHVAKSLDVAGMWRRACSVRLFDAELPTLRAEDLFVALSLHAGEHGWSQLSLFCDLGRLLRVSPSFDWDLVRSHTADANTRRTVDVTLLLLANCFGIFVPPDLLRREMQVELIAARVATEFWSAPERSAHHETNLEWIRERCRGERLGDRLRWTSGLLLTPTLADFKTCRLPDSLMFLYPALRVLRLAFRRTPVVS